MQWPASLPPERCEQFCYAHWEFKPCRGCQATEHGHAMFAASAFGSAILLALAALCAIARVVDQALMSPH